MKKQGFTLIELICVIAIVSILIILINNLVVVNFKVSEKSYENEMEYKNSTNCMLYIENIIRKAEKIEGIDEKSNLKFYVKNKNGTSTYRFVQQNDDLYVYINNLNTSSKKETKIPIGKCQSSYIFYDKNKKGIDISINFIENNDFSYFKTYIGVDI